MTTMRIDLCKDFKTRHEAADYRDFMISRGFNAYYEEWGSFDGLFYSVNVFEKTLGKQNK